ncbi:MAG: 4-(cytidine 5'-diphospho)-2-C-methyl-D-erythritol kinase [Chitinophagales bacterium]
MISFPNCKINLGLRILNRRADGYHNLISVFYPVQWCDALEFIESAVFSFESGGLKIDGSAEDNLCAKAYRLLQKLYALPPVMIALLKNIPMGAGLGGGSADGAFMLKMLSEYFKLNLSGVELKSHALQLGSDCPFFLENKPKLVTGKGELLETIAIDLSAFHAVIIYPEIAINTASAFREYAKAANKIAPDALVNFREVLKLPILQWKDFLLNDFEPVVVKQYPEIGRIKKQLYDAGALYASMSGSGSAVYGIFQDKPDPVSIVKNGRTYTGKF